MKNTYYMSFAIMVFAIAVTAASPFLVSLANDTSIDTYKSNDKKVLSSTKTNVKDVASAIDEASNLDVAIASSSVKEEVVEQPKEEKTVVQTQASAVYDNMTLEQLSAKLDRSLNSTLTGTGNLFAKYSIDYGVDPYVAVAITLLETGCKWSCSPAVTTKNNVGGMYGGGSLLSFDSLESGIEAFIKNLKTGYYDQGLNTPELMNKKYASSTTWSEKVNNYIEIIKNA